MADSSYLKASGSINTSAVLRAAHAEAKASVAAAAKRGKVRRYRIALRDALTFAWISARTQKECFLRDLALAALPASHAALLVERTCALMADSTLARDLAVAAIDARAREMGMRL